MSKKKMLKIIICMFIVTSILQILLKYIINTQILSRILFGVDYNTYAMNYYQGLEGLIGLISNQKIPYDWIFVLSQNIIVFCCVIALYFTIKKLSKNNKLNKKEFYTIISGFSLLSLYEVIIYIFLFFQIPPVKISIIPIIFIVSAYMYVYKIMYQKDRIKKKMNKG